MKDKEIRDIFEKWAFDNRDAFQSSNFNEFVKKQENGEYLSYELGKMYTAFCAAYKIFANS